MRKTTSVSVAFLMVLSILIHTEKTLINMFSNRENIDTTVQGPELQCFLKVSRPSLSWENSTHKNRLSRHSVNRLFSLICLCVVLVVSHLDFGSDSLSSW